MSIKVDKAYIEETKNPNYFLYNNPIFNYISILNKDYEVITKEYWSIEKYGFLDNLKQYVVAYADGLYYIIDEEGNEIYETNKIILDIKYIYSYLPKRGRIAYFLEEIPGGRKKQLFIIENINGKTIVKKLKSKEKDLIIHGITPIINDKILEAITSKGITLLNFNGDRLTEFARDNIEVIKGLSDGKGYILILDNKKIFKLKDSSSFSEYVREGRNINTFTCYYPIYSCDGYIYNILDDSYKEGYYKTIKLGYWGAWINDSFFKLYLFPNIKIKIDLNANRRGNINDFINKKFGGTMDKSVLNKKNMSKEDFAILKREFKMLLFLEGVGIYE